MCDVGADTEVPSSVGVLARCLRLPRRGRSWTSIFVYILDIFISTSSFHSNAMHESFITTIQCPRSSLCHPTIHASTGHPTFWAPVRFVLITFTLHCTRTVRYSSTYRLKHTPDQPDRTRPDQRTSPLGDPTEVYSYSYTHPHPIPWATRLHRARRRWLHHLLVFPPDCRGKKAFTLTLSDAKTTAGVSLPHSRTPGPCTTTYRDRCFLFLSAMSPPIQALNPQLPGLNLFHPRRLVDNSPPVFPPPSFRQRPRCSCPRNRLQFSSPKPRLAPRIDFHCSASTSR